MSTLWNEDEGATFAVNLGYVTIPQANDWLAKRDRTVGRDKALGPLLLEEGVISEAQLNMMNTLMGKPAEAAAAGNPNYQMYLECKQAARKGDIAACEKLLGRITDPDYRYRAEILTMKAQNARGELDKLDGDE